MRSGLGFLTSRGAAPDFLTIDLANALILLGYGLTWTGARVFDGAIDPALSGAAGAGGLDAAVPPARLSMPRLNLRVVIVSTALALFALMTAEEFWRGRDEPLMSRWPSIIVLLAYAAALAGARAGDACCRRPFADDSLLSGLSFALLAFGTLLVHGGHGVSSAQHDQGAHRAEAQDQFAGRSAERRRQSPRLSRRRSGFAGAAGRSKREPLAVMLFDLDHFKQINDRLGHAVGDTVLQTFAGTATTHAWRRHSVRAHRRRGIRRLHAGWRPRRGVSPLPTACGAISPLRPRASATPICLPSVSGGVTLGCDPQAQVLELLSIVDRALYRAKEHGRNRVETEVRRTKVPWHSAPSIVPIIGPERVGLGTAVAALARGVLTRRGSSFGAFGSNFQFCNFRAFHKNPLLALEHLAKAELQAPPRLAGSVIGISPD